MKENKGEKQLAVKLDVPQEILASNRPGGIYTCVQLARAVHKGEGVLRSRYVELCKHIHAEQMTHDAVTWCLEREGFRKERISEIKRVCFDTDENFQLFVKGIVGFKHALEIARSAEPTEDADVIRRLRWNKLFSAFDRLIGKFKPVRPFHVANGNVLVTWSDRQFVEDKKVISIPGYRVTVERSAKPDAETAARKGKNKGREAKEKVKSHDKETSGGSVSAGADAVGSGISLVPRRGDHVQG